MSAEPVNVRHKASGNVLLASRKAIKEGEFPPDEYEVVETPKPTKKSKPEGGGSANTG